MRKKNAQTGYPVKGFHRPKAGDRFKSMGGTSEGVNVSVGVPIGAGRVFSGFRMLGYPVVGKGRGGVYMRLWGYCGDSRFFKF